MNLLKKLTSKKKETKSENYYDFYLNTQINNLKNHIQELSKLKCKDQKGLREEKINLIIKELDQISHLYANFIYELKRFETAKKSGQTSNFDNLEETIYFMLEKKKSLHREFENIYKLFKNCAIGLENIPMDSILSSMEKAFDFDSEKYNTVTTPNYIQN